MTEITIESICRRWESAERPLFKGSLIDDDGCCCAQGDILRVRGWSDEQLLGASQEAADVEVARLLGISRAHSVLLRHVNDRADGCPQDVLQNPEKVLGDQAERVLAFWRRLDEMTVAEWEKVAAAWAAARAAARHAAWASNEIQGSALMKERGQPFFFLPMFGINDPAELDT